MPGRLLPNAFAVQRRRAAPSAAGASWAAASPRCEELVDRKPDVPRDLAYESWRDVPSRVKRNGGRTTIGVPELLVRTALANLGEPVRLQKGNDFPRLEDGDPAHRQATWIVRTSTNSDSSVGSPSSKSISITSRRFC